MATANKTPVLTVEHVTMRFGGLTAVSDLSFEANRNEITALIGPNGAGKTTVFNCITGFYKPTEGKIALRHADGTEFLLERMDDFRIAQNAKVARTFQNIRLFSGMTVLENLMVAQHNKLMVASGYTVAGVLGSGHYRRAEKDAIELAKAWLEKVRLIDRAASKSRAPCAPSRGCSASTSRRPASTRASRRNSTSCCAQSAPRTTCQSCSSSMT
jgi:branched-chain amino acid transport system ATP-binding protein